jgi:hypothetical protein
MAKEQTAEMYIGKYRTELPMYWICGSADGSKRYPETIFSGTVSTQHSHEQPHQFSTKQVKETMVTL